ncbi:UspA domain-containing protein [Stanieria cyanosphaera PCC 7437]|uniref:UspA domain-containing protein n=1 Tax=Stanieria cyanosphaera (strain ATCC 29371 / PCC 7437) TaxID=111780 RepID=K9Y0E1_STAC7|nr:universal stress protein [Stanieria cyanosphaera]AFZ37861.1 UspA domain-containing protein [Stanieria cyanosphaera PCC 7437]
MVFKKILIALDRSSQSAMIVKQALFIAETQGSQLMLFHCLDLQTEEISPVIGIGTLSDVNMYNTFQRLHHESLQKDLEQVRDWLATYCEYASAKNITAELDYRIGNPGVLICDRAKNWGADLIILGRRGYSGLSELIMGSVSNYVTHHAPCSVLIVQGIQAEEDEEFSQEISSNITN